MQADQIFIFLLLPLPFDKPPHGHFRRILGLLNGPPFFFCDHREHQRAKTLGNGDNVKEATRER